MTRTITILLTGLLATTACEAQLPVATGRQIAMSRSQWRMFVPDGYTARAGGDVDLLVHFHGDPQTVWNNAEHAELNAVIVTVNYNGLSSAYRTPFSDASLFQQLLNDARTRLAAQPDFGATTNWDKLAVSSFSAGYGAVREILKSPGYFDAIDSLLAADSLYATTASDGTALDSQMVDYKRYAAAAAAGDKRFIFTHSQVPTFTYESTEETGDELLQHLGLATQPTNQAGLGTLRFYRTAEQNGFELWGATGANGDAHLAHLRYMGEWLDDLGLAPRNLPGDFNADGKVDAADYTMWRDGYRWTYTDADYDVWVQHFGEGVTNAISVPEASAASLTLFGLTPLSHALRLRRE